MKTVRTFIAIEIPGELKRQLGAVQETLRGVPGAMITWTRPEGMHLTLSFLGDVEQHRLREVVGLMRAAAELYPPIGLKTLSVGAFPGLNRPRVLWMGIDGGRELKRLQVDLENRLADAGLVEPDDRFHPHLTLGRVKGLERGSRLPERFRSVQLQEYSWRAEQILVMTSILKPTGAEYSVVAAVPLAG